MTTPNIRHASTCTDPQSKEYVNVVLWKTSVGEMRRVVYGCSDCGATVQIEAFEAVAEED